MFRLTQRGPAADAETGLNHVSLPRAASIVSTQSAVGARKRFDTLRVICCSSAVSIVYLALSEALVYRSKDGVRNVFYCLAPH